MMKEEERLEALLLEGLQSLATELTAEDWWVIRQEAATKLNARQHGTGDAASHEISSEKIFKGRP